LIGLTGDTLENAKRTIDEIVSKLNQVEAGKLAQSWSDDAFSARKDLMPEDQAREMEFERERQQRQMQLDSYMQDESISIERRKQLNKGFNDWLIYERMRVDRANESQMMKQVRDWAQLGQHIQGALTQAMSSFV